MYIANSSPAQLTRAAANPPFSFFVYFILKCSWWNVRNPFHDFSWFSETNGMVLELFCKIVPESLYRGTMPPIVTWYVSNFGHLTKLTFQCYFKCKTSLARCDHWYLTGEEPSCTITFYEKKTGVTRAWRFLRTNKKSHFFGGTLPKICIISTFRWADNILLQKSLTIDIWKYFCMEISDVTCPRTTYANLGLR